MLQWHQAIESFNYDLVVDWALSCLEQGVETENILILASFSKPVDSYEIKPYVSAAISDLDLEEKYGEYSIVANVHYHLAFILDDIEPRRNLGRVYELCLEADSKFGLGIFYSLYHGWSSLEEDGYNYYYEGATLENINELLKKEAKEWIDEYIHGIEKPKIETRKVNNGEAIKEASKAGSIWERLRRFWMGE